MALTDNEALNKIVDLLQDLKKLQKGQYNKDEDAQLALNKP